MLLKVGYALFSEFAVPMRRCYAFSIVDSSVYIVVASSYYTA